MNELLIEEARSWVGTPWVHNQRSKGFGVDCVQLVMACGVKVGLSFEVDNYERVPRGNSLRANLESKLTEIPIKEIVSGNVLLFAIGGLETHVGFYTDGGLIHADQRAGKVVEISSLGYWKKLIAAAYKLPEN